MSGTHDVRNRVDLYHFEEEEKRIQLARQRKQQDPGPANSYYMHRIWIWRSLRLVNSRHEEVAWKKYRTVRAIERMRAQGVSEEKIRELLVGRDVLPKVVIDNASGVSEVI